MKPYAAIFKLILVMLLFTLVSGCSTGASSQTSVPSQMLVAPSARPTGVTATNTPLPPTQTPQPTFTPLPSPTPTLSLPVQAETSVPVSSEKITAENASRLVKLAQYGEGYVFGLAFSHKGDLLAALSRSGLEIYRAGDFGFLCRFSLGITSIDLVQWHISIAFTPDDKYVVFPVDQKGTIYQVDTQTCAGSNPWTLNTSQYYPGESTFYDISEDASQLLISRVDGWPPKKVYLADLSSKTITTVAERSMLPGNYADRDCVLYYQVVMSSDARLFAGQGEGLSCFTDPYSAEIRLWDIQARKLLWAGKASFSISKMAFSSDAQKLAALGHRTQQGLPISLWNATDGKLVWNITLPKELTSSSTSMSIRFSKDSNTIAVGSSSGMIALLDAEKGQVNTLLEGSQGPVAELAFSPDGSRLASYSYDLGIQIWDLATGKPINPRVNWHFPRQGHVVLSPDGRWLASFGWDDVKVIDLVTGKIVQTLPGEDAAQFSPDGRLLLTIQPREGLTLWSIPDFKPVQEHEGVISWARFITGDKPQAPAWLKIRFLSVDGGAPTDYIAYGEQYRSSVSSDGQWLAGTSVTGDQAVLYRVKDGANVKQVPSSKYSLPVISPNGSYFSVLGCPDPSKCQETEDATVSVVTTSQPSQMFSLPLDPNYWYSDILGFSPDEQLLMVSVFYHGNATSYHIQIWDINNKTKVAELPMEIVPWGIAFSQDGTRLAIAMEEWIQIWGLDPR